VADKIECQRIINRQSDPLGSQMKHINLAIIFMVTVFSGCSTSPMYQDIEKTEHNATVTQLSKSERLQMTYRFRENLIADEYNAFSQYLGSDEAKQELTTDFEGAIGISAGIAEGMLMNSTVWENAYKSGNIINVGVSSLVVGTALNLVTAEARERRSIAHTLYLNEAKWDDKSETDVTQLQRKRTVDTIYEFAESMDYSIECIDSCLFIDNKLTLELTLKNKNKQIYFKPSWIRLGLILKPLQKVKNDYDRVLLGNRYQYKSEGKFGWFISTSTTKNDALPIYKALQNGQSYLANEESLGGTFIYQKLFELLTLRLPGYSNFYNTNHIHLAFLNGKTYKLYDELTDNSIVEGELTKKR
jgi:hypothetical protein